MTEYDFSPEAQDRYQATMRRISRWVDDTEAHKGEFRCAVETDPREFDLSSSGSSSSGGGRRVTARDLTRESSSSSRRRGASLDARPPPPAIYAPLPGPMPAHYLSPPPQQHHHRSHPVTRHPTPGVYGPATKSYGPTPASVYGATPTPVPISAHRTGTPTPVPVYVPPVPAPGYLHAPAPRYAPTPVPAWSQPPPPPPLSAQPHHYHHRQSHSHSYLPGPTPYVVVPPPGAVNMRVVVSPFAYLSFAQSLILLSMSSPSPSPTNTLEGSCRARFTRNPRVLLKPVEMIILIMISIPIDSAGEACLETPFLYLHSLYRTYCIYLFLLGIMHLHSHTAAIINSHDARCKSMA